MCHASAQSSWEVAESSYDVCNVLAQSRWEDLRVAKMCVMCQFTVAATKFRAPKLFVMFQLRVAGK